MTASEINSLQIKRKVAITYSLKNENGSPVAHKLTFLPINSTGSFLENSKINNKTISKAWNNGTRVSSPFILNMDTRSRWPDKDCVWIPLKTSEGLHSALKRIIQPRGALPRQFSTLCDIVNCWSLIKHLNQGMKTNKEMLHKSIQF